MNHKSRILFAACLLALTLTVYRVPYYDWDLVAYVGSAIALHERDARAVQAEAYAALKRELPEDDYQDIAAGSEFRRDLAVNSNHFQQQLRFYSIRPLYTWILAALHAVGIGYVPATRLISAAAFACIGFLLFCWTRRYVSEWHAAIGALLLLVAPVIFTSARTGSPDALSAFAVLLGIFELFERRRLLVGAAILFASLFLRTDNVLMVTPVLLAVAFIRETQHAAFVRSALAISLAILAIGTVVAINHFEHSYGWTLLVQNTETPTVNPAEIVVQFAAKDYFSAWKDMVDEARENSVTVFPFVAALALFSSRVPARLKLLTRIVLLSWLAHVVLFPHLEDRYFVAGAAIVGVAAMAALGRSTETIPGEELG